MLLDTHVMLWLLMDNAQLGHRAKETMKRATNVYVSAASAWETAIKVASGRLTAPKTLLAQVTEADLTWLSVTPHHAWAVGELRGLPHADPFDRLLVAQAAAEQLTFVTADRAILAAPIIPAVTVLDARQ